MSSWAITASSAHNVVALLVAAQVSSKSIPGFCLKPLTTSLALKRMISPAALRFRSKTQRTGIGLNPGGDFAGEIQDGQKGADFPREFGKE